MRCVIKYTLQEAATCVLILWQLSFILAGGSFFTFSLIFSHSILTSILKRTKYFFQKLNSFQPCLGYCSAIYEMLHLNAETNGLTCPILDNHVAEDVSKNVSLFWEEDSVIK